MVPIFPIFLLPYLANAAEGPDADGVDLAALRAWHATTADVALKREVPAFEAQGIVFEDDLATIAFDDGLLFPVHAGDPGEDAEADEVLQRRIGFVFIGTGTLTVDIPDRGSRLRLANRIVSEGGTVGAMAEVVAGAPFRTTIHEGLILSADPRVVDRLAGATVAALDEATFRPLLRRAEGVLDERLELTGIDDNVRDDLLEREMLGKDPSDGLVYADFHTSQRYGAVPNRDEDSWLAYLYDPSAELDPRWQAEVVALGRNLQGDLSTYHVAGLTHPLVDGVPVPDVRIDPVFADTTVATRQDGLSLAVEITSEITVEAVGASAQRITVVVPRHESAPGTWALEGVDADGIDEEITWVAADDEAFSDQSGEVVLVLPRPLEVGASLTLSVRSRGTWPYGNVTDLGSLGRSSGLQAVIPGLDPGRVGNPWRFVTRVGVPSDDDLTASISGVTRSVWEEDGLTWVEAGEDARDALWPQVAVGTWIGVDDPAQQGMPAMRVHLFPEHRDSIASFPPEMRRIVSYFQEVLPDLPFPELELFQAPSMFYGFVWIAPHAMVNLQATMVFDQVGIGESLFRNDRPHLESGVLAHEIAHQYWGHLARPASIQDFWIAETFAETYSCLYMGAAFGPGDYQARLDAYREDWERVLPRTGVREASLVHAYSSDRQPQIVYEYGPYVFLEMLRPRIGDTAFLSALDVLLRERPHTSITTELIRGAFEAASGEDLGDFFDYWVVGGYLPALSLEAEVRGGVLTGTLTSDVPFGTLDVPIVVATTEGDRTFWVDVVDGVGIVDADVGALVGRASRAVTLDPEGRVLARQRRVRVR